jgi:hypothetical protein
VKGARGRASDAARTLVGTPTELMVRVTRKWVPATRARELVSATQAQRYALGESEHGRMTQFGPQLAPIDGVDVAEQVGVALVILPHQDTELREQHVIVQRFERVIRGHAYH